MDFLGYFCGEMFLNLFSLRNPNRYLSDFAIFFGSLLCPVFNEWGILRVRTDRRKERIYAEAAAAAAAAEAEAAAAAARQAQALARTGTGGGGAAGVGETPLQKRLERLFEK